MSNLDKKIDELVQNIPIWHNISMRRAMADGDPKHNKEYQAIAKREIKSLVANERERTINEVKDFADKRFGISVDDSEWEKSDESE